MKRRLPHMLILPAIAVIVVWATGLHAAPLEPASPPELKFIYHDNWWSHDAFSADAVTYRTVAGDFNGDGRDDIAMLYRTDAATVNFYVILSEEDHFEWQDNWLQLGGFLNADMMTGRVVAGDFNNDGLDDIAAFAGTSNTFAYVFLSDGFGFAQDTWWNGDADYQFHVTGRVVAGDFDGDGFRDDIVALYDEGSSAIRADVFLSDGGSFAEPRTWWSSDAFIAGKTTYRVVAGDFDADGRDDVGMIYDYSASEMHLNVLESTGSGFIYQSRMYVNGAYIAGRTTGRVIAGDFDGDGDDDISLLYDYLNSVIRSHVLLSRRQFLLNEGFSYQGSIPGWWEHPAYAPNYAAGRVVAGDWDGDSVDDAGMVYRTSDSSARAQVLKSTAPSPGPATTRQVDRADSGCNDETGGPYCTIQAAVDAANDGDTILVAAGEYNEHVSLPKYSDPGFNQSLTVQGDGAVATFVDGEESGTVFTIHPGGVIALNALAIRNGAAENGAGILNDGGRLAIGNAVLDGNIAGDGGGGIYNLRGMLTINDSNLNGNSAEWGGGIANENGAVTVNRSSLSDNSGTTYGGGAIYNFSDAPMIIRDSVISGNAGYEGGGIFNEGELITVINSTIDHNTAAHDGGGVSISEGTVVLSNSTVSDNMAGGIGGGIFNDSVVDIRNSMVANSMAGEDCAGPGDWYTGSAPNLDSDNTCPGFTLTGDPLLGSLQDNGGPTWSRALLEGSPAIDAGDNELCTPADQRGAPRPRDGNGDGTAVCDIGAYEVGGSVLFLPLAVRP